MTFVDGPEETSFRDEKPAKIRFFMGYADEFARADGSDQASRGAVADLDAPRVPQAGKGLFFFVH